MKRLAALAGIAAAALIAASPAQATYPPGKNGRLIFTLCSSTPPNLCDLAYVATPTAGAPIAPITSTPGLSEQDAAYNPTGRRLAISLGSGADRELALINPDGTGLGAPITSNPGPATVFGPDFAPDGSRIAFFTDNGTDDLFSVEPDGSGLLNLTNTASPLEEGSPSYAPDGRSIVHDAADSTGTRLVTARPSGEFLRLLVQSPAGSIDVAPTFTPDGKFVYFTRFTFSAGEADVYAVRADGSGLTNLTNTPAPTNESNAVPSPDGRVVAFIRDNQLWAMDPGGAGQVQIAAAPSGTVLGGVSWETIRRCGGRRPTLVGDDGPDKLRGTRKADVIVGLGGRDSINGLAGNDRICGGAGKDVLRGGKGKDRLKGGPGRDREIPSNENVALSIVSAGGDPVDLRGRGSVDEEVSEGDAERVNFDRIDIPEAGEYVAGQRGRDETVRLPPQE